MSFAPDAYVLRSGLMLYPESARDREDTHSGVTARSRRHETGVSQIEFRIPRSEACFSQPATDPDTNDDDYTGIRAETRENAGSGRINENRLGRGREAGVRGVEED